MLKAFENREPHRIDVPPLTDDERFEIVKQVPSISAKSLDPKQIKLLLENPATANPLFLLVALEELRGFGSFVNSSTVAFLLSPVDPLGAKGASGR